MRPAELALLRQLDAARDPEAEHAVLVEALRARFDDDMRHAFDAACVIGRFHPGILARVLDVSLEEAGRRYAALEALSVVQRHVSGGCRMSRTTRRAVRRELAARAPGLLETWSARAASFFASASTPDDRAEALRHAFWGAPESVGARLEELDGEVDWSEPPGALVSRLEELSSVATLRANAVGASGRAIAAFLTGLWEYTQERPEAARRSFRSAVEEGAPAWLVAACGRLARPTTEDAAHRLAVFVGWRAEQQTPAVAEVLRAVGYEVLSLDLEGAGDPAQRLGIALAAHVRPGGQLIVWFTGESACAFGSEGVRARIGGVRDQADAPGLDVASVAVQLCELGARQILAVFDGAFSGPLPLHPLFESVDERIEYREDYEYSLRTPARVALASHGRTKASGTFAECVRVGLGGAAPEGGIVTSAALYRHLVAVLPEGLSVSRWAFDERPAGDYVVASPRGPALPPAPALTPENNPFLGLKPYARADHERFHGRDKETQTLLERVGASPFTAVVGASGTGKSSLVQAGLVASLPAGEYAWARTLQPGANPAARLADVLDEAIVGFAPAAPESERAPDAVAIAQTRLRAALARARPRRSVLVIDQFEELYTLTSESDREAFLALLAAEFAGGTLRLVVTVRADFELLARQGAFERWWAAGRYHHAPLDPSQLREALRRIARRQAIHFEPVALVDRIASDTAGERGGMALMSFALSDLYAELAALAPGPSGRVIRLRDYELGGGVRGSLQTCAERLYAELEEAEQLTMRRLLLRMATVRGAEPTRRRASRPELDVDDARENERVAHVLERLERARLIVRRRDAYGECVELAHEVLIVAWPRLWRFIHEDRDRELRERVAQAAAENAAWHDHRELDAVLKRVRRDPSFLSHDEHLFLTAARRQRDRRRRQAVVIALVVLVLGAGLAIGWVRVKDIGDAKLAGEVAQQQVDAVQKEAEEAKTDRNAAQEAALVSKARTLRETYPFDPERSLLLATYGAELFDSDGSQRELRDALRAFPPRQRYGVKGRVDAIAWSGDSRLFATVAEGVVQVIERASARVVYEVRRRDASERRIALSADGALLAVLDGGRLGVERVDGKPMAIPKGLHQIIAFDFLSRTELVTLDADLKLVHWRVRPAWERLEQHALAEGLDRPCHIPGGAPGPMCWASFGAHGGLLAVAVEGADRVLLWRVAPKMEELPPMAVNVKPKPAERGIAFAAFSADGARVVVTDAEGLSVRTPAGQSVWRIAAESSIVAAVGVVGGASAGSFAVAGGDGAQVKLWREGGEAKPWRYVLHARNVGLAAWSPAGSLLATAGEDAVVRVWDVAGPDKAALVAHLPYKEVKDFDLWFRAGIAWAPDGSALAVPARDAEHLDVWSLAKVDVPATRADLIAAACARISEELSREELAKLGLGAAPNPCAAAPKL